MALVLPLYFRDPKWRLAGGRPTWVGRLSVVGALFVAAGLVYGAVRERRDVIHTSRDFYGILRVIRTPLASQDDALVQLIHGRITHGAQYTSESRRSQPTLYFGRQSGAGLAIQHHRNGDGSRHLGVIGLGAGTLAVYGRPQDRVRFYEINPEVVRLAREYFSFLADCPARCDVVLGDARLVMEAELERGDPQGFDVLALDAFSSDSIPTHLLTREAVQVYLRHLRPDGILAVHISNRHFDLAPVLAELAQQESLASCVVESRADLDGIVSHWVLLSPHAESLDAPVFEGLPSLAGSRTVAWTDDHCSLLAVLRPLTPDRLLFVAGDNDEFVVHAQRGISLLESGNLPSAEAEFRAALKIDARNAGAWLHLGNVLRLKSQQEDAVACYERAIKFDPSSSEAYNNLGGMLASRDAARAQECLHQALQLDPRNARTHSNLGNLLARRRELDAAIAHYEQALAIDPELADARKNLAIVQQWQREGDPKAPQ
jgi:tetratricopeptide (TPR) repeat protein